MDSTSTPNERIVEARERAGLTEEQAAARAGLPLAWYHDLEHDPNEADSNVSLASLRDLAAALGISVEYILEGAPASAPTQCVSAAELATAVGAEAAAEGIGAWSERVGWDVAPLLDDSERLWEYTADALRDICAAVRLDWRAVLPV